MFKRITILGIVVVMLMALSGTAFAQEPVTTPSDSITVVGYGTAYAAPDIAYVSVGVEILNPDVQAAVNEATNTINAVNAALTEFGISEADIRTENFYIFRESIYTPEGVPGQGSFRVSHLLRITVRETERVPEILAAVLGAGANSVGGVTYDVADKAAVESQARAAAIENARVKAEELAGLVSVTIGDVVSVSEVPNYGIPYGYGGGGGGVAMDTVAPPPIAPGSLAVSVSVQITYSIVR